MTGLEAGQSAFGDTVCLVQKSFNVAGAEFPTVFGASESGACFKTSLQKFQIALFLNYRNRQQPAVEGR